VGRNQKLRAKFFVNKNGEVIPKARQLHCSERLKIFNDEGRCCKICSRPLKFCRRTINFIDECLLAHVDHIIPRSRGGQNTRENLRLLCERCNSQLGAGI
jgi:5-methylcytosine-specific restriction endonuclease McrA